MVKLVAPLCLKKIMYRGFWECAEMKYKKNAKKITTYFIWLFIIVFWSDGAGINASGHPG
jgi:hypothetical protein